MMSVSPKMDRPRYDCVIMCDTACVQDSFERGMEFHGKVTVLGEGCRGHLTKQLVNKLGLRDEGVEPMSYAIGLKELWEVSEDTHRPGHVEHTVGFPLVLDYPQYATLLCQYAAGKYVRRIILVPSQGW